MSGAGPVLEILEAAKKLAQQYRVLTGKPLGITGEVAEYEAARILGLTLTAARQAGYDATEDQGGRIRRLQIKGRCVLNGNKVGQRIGSIDVSKEFDAVLVVLLDGNFEATAIYEAERGAVLAALAKPGSKARNERGALSVGQFLSIGQLRWQREVSDGHGTTAALGGGHHFPKEKKSMALCECGCGAEANRGHFLPGHDQRLRTSLEQLVGGILPLRTLVETCHAYHSGGVSEAHLVQTVRGIFSTASSVSADGDGERDSCREAIIKSAKAVMDMSGLDYFTIPEVVEFMSKHNTRYAESTIRTHITSRMCANAPDHHAVTYPDLERTGRGTYKLIR